MDLAQLLTSIVPFVKTVGVAVDDIGRGTCTAHLPDRKEIQNHLGTLHAGAAYTLGETASGGVVLSLFADQVQKGGFIALKSAEVRHLKAAPGETRAQAQVVGDGKAIRATFEDSGKVDFPVRVELYVGELLTTELVYTWAVRAPRG